jgi:uncharacterized protein (DUF952 family)
MVDKIYHITSMEEWKLAIMKGYYEAPSLAIEGFIHCSTESQVEGVLNRYYSGKTNLVKLEIDTTLLTHPLKYELAPSIQEEFPHVFGVINIDAVIEPIQL